MRHRHQHQLHRLLLIAVLLFLAIAHLGFAYGESPSIASGAADDASAVGGLAEASADLPITLSPITLSAGERQLVESARRRIVRVVDARSGDAIAGAAVRHGSGTPNAIEWDTAITNAAGAAAFGDDCEGVVVAVSASGYAPAVEAWNVRGAAHTVRLDRGAALRLRFVGAAGQPVSGVSARLLAPPSTGPEWDADWQRASDTAAWGEPLVGNKAGDLAARLARGLELTGGRTLPAVADCLRDVLSESVSAGADGVIEYAGLPAGAGWRWGLASSQMIEMVPVHESATLSTDAHGVRATAARRIDTLSGLIALAPGETRELTIRVFGKGSLRGLFPAVATALRPQVKLFHMTATDPGSKVRAVECSLEAFATADADGSFCFEGVRPGPKVVRAYWRTSEIDYVFATAAASLADHQDLDLGLVQPLLGDLAVRVDLQNRAQRVVSLASVLADAEPAALLNISTWDKPGAIGGSIHEIVSVPLSTTVRLHGLTFGKVRLRSVCGPDWLPQKPTQRLLDSPGVEVEAPLPDVVHVPLAFEERVTRELTIAVPTAQRPLVELWLRPIRGGDPERIRVPRGNGDATVSLAVLAEPYEVLARTAAAAEGADFVGNATLDFTTTTGGLIHLTAGAVVRGRCRSATGAPLANRRLLWTRTGWRRDSTNLWLFGAETDGEGRFVIAGLPPGGELQGSRRGTSFVAPAAGAVAEVDLLVQR